MIKHVLLSFLVVFILFAAPAARADTSDDDAVIGTVLEVQGKATVTDSLGSHAAQVNTEIHMNDVVATGPGAHVFILLIDNTEWTLAENSRFRVDQYVFDPNDNTNNKARYSVLDGAFNYVSGLVAKKPDPDVKIATPIGSIGIRGTDFWGGMIDGQYGVMVNEGRVDVKTEAGEMLVNQGLGTFIANRSSKPTNAAAWSPQRLAKIRDTVNLKNNPTILARKQQIQGRHQELRQKLKEKQQRKRERLQQNNQDRKEKWRDRQGRWNRDGNDGNDGSDCSDNDSSNNCTDSSDDSGDDSTNNQAAIRQQIQQNRQAIIQRLKARKAAQ